MGGIKETSIFWKLNTQYRKLKRERSSVDALRRRIRIKKRGHEGVISGSKSFDHRDKAGLI